jgi:hypothetical protein
MGKSRLILTSMLITLPGIWQFVASHSVIAHNLILILQCSLHMLLWGVMEGTLKNQGASFAT